MNRWICVGALVPCFGHAGPYINVAPFPSGRTSQPSGNAGGDCGVAPSIDRAATNSKTTEARPKTERPMPMGLAVTVVVWRSALVIVRPETVWVANSKLGQNPSFSSVLRSVVKKAFVVFGNSTISLHILRGVLAAAAIYGSLATMSRTIWPSIILLPTAVYLMKG